MKVSLSIDKSSPLPLYYQVISGIEAAINRGELEAGSWLESEVDLAARHSLSRPTVRRAMDELVRSGLLIRRRGVGTQVAAPTMRRSLELTSLHDDLARSGRDPGTRVVSFSHMQADDHVRGLLNLPEGASVYHFVRVRTAAKQPLALMENWVRDDLVKIERARLEEDGLYTILRSHGVDFRLAHQKIGARLAEERQCRLLRIPSGTALVTVERVALDGAGRHVEIGRHAYRADAYSFDMTLVRR